MLKFITAHNYECLILKKKINVYLTERGSDRLAQERGRHVGNGGQNEVVQCWPVDDRRVVFAKTFAT